MNKTSCFVNCVFCFNSVSILPNSEDKSLNVELNGLCKKFRFLFLNWRPIMFNSMTSKNCHSSTIIAVIAKIAHCKLLHIWWIIIAGLLLSDCLDVFIDFLITILVGKRSFLLLLIYHDIFIDWMRLVWIASIHCVVSSTWKHLLLYYSNTLNRLVIERSYQTLFW